MTSGWSPRLEENKRRIMQSSIFGDEQPSRQQAPVERSPTRPPPQNQPMYSPEKQYRPQNQNDAAPSNYAYQPPPISPIKSPKFDGLVTQSNVPGLSSFPEVNLTQLNTPQTFNFDLKPRTPLRQTTRSLQFKPNAQLKILRDNIENDMKQFTQRISHLNVNAPIEMKDPYFPQSEQAKRETKSEAPKADRSKADILKRQKALQKKEKLAPPEYVNDPVIPNEMNNRRPLNNSVNMNLSASTGDSIGFTTHSEFIMPDGTQFQ